MTVSTHPDLPRYSFDNDDPESVDRHEFLSRILDEKTFARISGVGGDLTGWRCLELGAGGGSVARWLADQAGPTGTVIATDLNPRLLPEYPGYQTLKHDLVHEPLPEGEWDLIHARLVLMHIPQRREILHRLANALAPGGMLFVEDWLTSLGRLVLAAPDDETAALINTYHDALVNRVLPGKGNDPNWAGTVHAAMLEEGLVDVDTQIQAGSWPGGSPGALLIAANIAQLREEFLAAGLTSDQLDDVCQAVTDPRLVLRGHLTYSTVGRRPGGVRGVAA